MTHLGPHAKGRGAVGTVMYIIYVILDYSSGIML